MTAAVAPDRRAVLRRRVRLLAAATITYNIVEAVVAISAGTVAGSVALIGFGLDSVIEVGSAAACVAVYRRRPRAPRADRAADRGHLLLRPRRLRHNGGGPHVDRRTRAGTVDRRYRPCRGQHPGDAVPVLGAASCRPRARLGSAVADSKQTLLCTYLSAAVLVGLVLNASLGWWWADPVVALGLAAVAVRVGREALHGDTCCTPVRFDDSDVANPRSQAGRSADACGCTSGCTDPCCS